MTQKPPAATNDPRRGRYYAADFELGRATPRPHRLWSAASRGAADQLRGCCRCRPGFGRNSRRSCSQRVTCNGDRAHRGGSCAARRCCSTRRWCQSVIPVNRTITLEKFPAIEYISLHQRIKGNEVFSESLLINPKVPTFKRF
uniref:Uncharacterized protein n=1 Tax=Romanomermis culicivorax TaxID=13658 RepID=A0A915IWY9_ROMCU